MASNSAAFDRSGWHYQVASYAALACSGWLLWHNVELSRVGLINVEGWSNASANPACWAMAALETSIMILLTCPDYWDDVWSALINFGENDSEVPGLVRYALVGLVLSVFLGLVAISYGFDFWTTHQGLYPGEAITTKTALFTLFFNLGSEALAFASGQVRRLAKKARARQLTADMQIDPVTAYSTRMHRELVRAADSKAEADARRAWDQFYRDNPGMRPN